MNNMNCNTCQAYHGVVTDSGGRQQGECRAGSPEFAAAVDMLDTPGAIWPLVRPFMWCLEYVGPNQEVPGYGRHDNERPTEQRPQPAV